MAYQRLTTKITTIYCTAMLRLELQEDTKKQIKEIYKSISIHSLPENIFSHTDDTGIEYGLGDRVLKAYYTANDMLLNKLVDMSERLWDNRRIDRVCDVIYTAKVAGRRNNNRGRPQKGGNHKGVRGEKTKTDICI